MKPLSQLYVGFGLVSFAALSAYAMQHTSAELHPKMMDAYVSFSSVDLDQKLSAPGIGHLSFENGTYINGNYPSKEVGKFSLIQIEDGSISTLIGGTTGFGDDTYSDCFKHAAKSDFSQIGDTINFLNISNSTALIPTTHTWRIAEASPSDILIRSWRASGPSIFHYQKVDKSIFDQASSDCRTLTSSFS